MHGQQNLKIHNNNIFWYRDLLYLMRPISYLNLMTAAKRHDGKSLIWATI